jgi:uncharacterized protein YjbJ (UPF0337 family)
MPLKPTTLDKIDRLAASMLPGHAIRRAARTDLAITDDGYARADRLRGSVIAAQVEPVPAAQVETSDGTPASVAADLGTQLLDMAELMVEQSVSVVDSASINLTQTFNGTNQEITAAAIFGSSAGTVAEGNHTHASGGISDFTEAAQDAVGGMIADTSSINLTYTDATPELKAEAIFGTSAGTVAEGNHTHTSAGITDFTEAAQDAVGGALLDTSSIDLTYNDGSNQISAAAIFGTSAGTVAEGSHLHDARYLAVRRPNARTGRTYGSRSSYGGTRTTPAALIVNTLQGGPISFPTDTPIDQLGLTITVAAAAGKLLRLMLYDEAADGAPGVKLEDSGSLAADPGAVPATVTYTVSRTLTAGRIYHLYVVSDGTPTVETSAGGVAVYGYDSAGDVANSRNSANKAHTYAAGPDPFGTPTTFGTAVPHVTVRVA